MQALSRVLPLRNFFLLPENYASCKSVLVQRFGALLRKTWNPRQFKGQVTDLSPSHTCVAWHFLHPLHPAPDTAQNPAEDYQDMWPGP